MFFKKYVVVSEFDRTEAKRRLVERPCFSRMCLKGMFSPLSFCYENSGKEIILSI